MKVQLLPSNCKEPAQLQPLTTFLVNDGLAIDGGSLGYGLTLEQQRQVRCVVITHSHIDHTASLPVFIAEVFPFLKEPVLVYSTREVISSLKEHIFNDLIWPDFHQIELLDGNHMGMRYVEVEAGVPFETHGLKITPVRTNHTVPTIGLAVEDSRSAVVFTSDTYHTEEIWHLANRLEHLKAIFVDVSYPNEMETLAATSKHLTPQSLDKELRKLSRDVPVYAVHLKPQYRTVVLDQLGAIRRPKVSAAEIGHDYVW